MRVFIEPNLKKDAGFASKMLKKEKKKIEKMASKTTAMTKYVANKTEQKPTTSQTFQVSETESKPNKLKTKPIKKFKFNKIEKVAVCSHTTPKQNFSETNISVVFKDSYYSSSFSSGFESMERFLFKIKYSQVYDYYELEVIKHRKSEHSESSDKILSEYCVSVEELIMVIKGALLFNALSPGEFVQSFMEALKSIEIVRDADNSIILTRSSNFNEVDEWLKKPIKSYTYYNNNNVHYHGQPLSHHVDYDYDKDDWSRYNFH